MSETFYFSHDYNTRADTKIKKILARHGYLGYGLFWAIVEDLYNNKNSTGILSIWQQSQKRPNSKSNRERTTNHRHCRMSAVNLHNIPNHTEG